MLSWTTHFLMKGATARQNATGISVERLFKSRHSVHGRYCCGFGASFQLSVARIDRDNRVRVGHRSVGMSSLVSRSMLRSHPRRFDSLTQRPAATLFPDKGRNFETVPNETVWLSSPCHDGSMLHKKAKKESDASTRTGVRNEIAKPRMARSARIAELNLDKSESPSNPGNRRQNHPLSTPEPTRKKHRSLLMGPTTG